ncbi:MAG: energy transducer TonB [Chitinivibrionales bacterium]
MSRPSHSKSAFLEDLVAPNYTRSGNNGFGFVVFLTLALFICAGLYFKTIKPRERALSEPSAKIVQTQFVMEEKKEKPKPPKPTPKIEDEKSKEPIDLTHAPVLAQKVDDVVKDAPPPKDQQVVRRVYGLRRVYSTGLGAGGDMADAVIGKRGNTINTDVDTVTATQADLKGKLVSITTVTTAPRLKSDVKPEYTKEMLAAKVEGVIKAILTIDVDGHVKDVKILNDLGYGTRESAREAFLKWIFEPARRGNEPVATIITYSIRFVFLEG